MFSAVWARKNIAVICLWARTALSQQVEVLGSKVKIRELSTSKFSK